MMKIFSSLDNSFPLPNNHRFPVQKYNLLRDELIRSKTLASEEIISVDPVDPITLYYAHDPHYVTSILDGSVSEKMMRQIGLPWSLELVHRCLSSVEGALRAAKEALNTGVSGNLSGGTHHAKTDQGQGYCVFNDLSVVSIYLLKNRFVHRVGIIDLDAHQGNGTAAILSPYAQVFTLSIHAEKIFPYRKVPSTLDIGLPDQTEDQMYINALSSALDQVIRFKPDLILYLAGVDPLKEDTLGHLSISMNGLALRDELVLGTCKSENIPVSLALGGGYAKPIQLTVDAHVQTYQVLKKVFSSNCSPTKK